MILGPQVRGAGVLAPVRVAAIQPFRILAPSKAMGRGQGYLPSTEGGRDEARSKLES